MSADAELTIDVLPAGNMLIIDTETKRATIKGQSYREHITGELGRFPVGANTVEYSDESGSREVTVEIKWRDRWA